MRTSRRAWINASLCGLLFFVGCHGILAWAEQTVSSGVAAIVLATIPFWILLIDVLFARDNRPNPYALIALLPGFVGVAIVAWQNVGGGGYLVPIIALAAASLSWAVGTVLSRNSSGEGSTMLLSGMQLLVGGVVLVAIALLTGETREFAPTAVSAASLEAALYLMVCGSVIGFAAYHWLLKNVPTQLVATHTFINPIVAVALGIAVLGEPLSTTTISGAILVVISIIAMWSAENFHAPSARSPGRSAASAAAAARRPACRPARDGTAACRRYRSRSAA
jgi:drug/metabolite transporter (DMT)-like permease